MPASVWTVEIGSSKPNLVRLDSSLGPGLPGCEVLGVHTGVARESLVRLRSAFLASGLTWPRQRVVVAVQVPGHGRPIQVVLDLALAGLILELTGQVPAGAIADCLLLGSVGLDGSIRPFAGCDHLAGHELTAGLTAVGADSRVVGRAVGSLVELGRCLRGEQAWPVRTVRAPGGPDFPAEPVVVPRSSRRVLEVAAAGGHDLLVIGHPPAPPEHLAVALSTFRLRASRTSLSAGGPTGVVKLAPGTPMAALIGKSWDHPGLVDEAKAGVLVFERLIQWTPGSLSRVLDHRSSMAKAHQPTRPAAALASIEACPCGGPPQLCRCGPWAVDRHLARIQRVDLSRFGLWWAPEEPYGPDAPPEDPYDETTLTAESAGRVARAIERLERTGPTMSAGSAGFRRARLSQAAARQAESWRRRGLVTPAMLERSCQVAQTIEALDSGAPELSVESLAEAVEFEVGARRRLYRLEDPPEARAPA
jgi:magnesium chelatase family protein